MIQITPDQTAKLKDWFVPEQPGASLVGLHVIQTGHGACFVDRWPEPLTVLADAGGSYALLGDPDVIEPADLRSRVAGFLEAPEPFGPLLRESFPELAMWDRVNLELSHSPRLPSPRASEVRRLRPKDGRDLRDLSPDSAWIWKTWDEPSRLAESGHAWGAFAEGRLVSVACTFFVGERYEEMGVVTEPEYRGMGLSTACAGALCADVQDRGRTPSWTTSPDNEASLRVALKLGFEVQRHSRLYVIGMPIPEPPRRPSAGSA